jgi:hypothetical protein
MTVSAGNKSTGTDKVWIDADGYEHHELISQEYTNCRFYAGIITNHPIDTHFVYWEKGDVKGGLFLRDDEVAALNWLCSGLLWSDALARLDERDNVKMSQS